MASIYVAGIDLSEAEKHYNAGLELRAAGRPREAIDEYSKAIAIDSNLPSHSLTEASSTHRSDRSTLPSKTSIRQFDSARRVLSFLRLAALPTPFRVGSTKPWQIWIRPWALIRCMWMPTSTGGQPMLS
jgi:hypothetical protein